MNITKDVYIDADSILYQCSGVQEKRFYTLKHKKSSNTLKIGSKKEAEEWIDRWVDERPSTRTKEDFIVEKSQELTGSIDSAANLFRVKVRAIIEGISKSYTVGETFICIQGKDNFRKDLPAKWSKYKANRVSEKPLLFEELRDYVLSEYALKCIVSDNEETDDVVVRACNSGNVVAYIDKDIVANSVGILYNYNSGELFYNSDTDRWMMFCTQMLIGDSSDNIVGVGSLSDSIRELYGISSKRCGKVSAEKILEGVKDEKEAFERVIGVYKNTHGEDALPMMQETATFLWMCREKGEKFCLITYLENLGIDYRNDT